MVTTGSVWYEACAGSSHHRLNGYGKKPVMAEKQVVASKGFVIFTGSLLQLTHAETSMYRAEMKAYQHATIKRQCFSRTVHSNTVNNQCLNIKAGV